MLIATNMTIWLWNY